jgi:hypothetical protein
LPGDPASDPPLYPESLEGFFTALRARPVYPESLEGVFHDLTALPDTDDAEEFREGLVRIEHDVLSRVGRSIDLGFEGTPERCLEVRRNVICQWWNEEVTVLQDMFDAGLETLSTSEISTLFGGEGWRITGSHRLTGPEDVWSIRGHWECMRVFGPDIALGCHTIHAFLGEWSGIMRWFRFFDFQFFQVLFSLFRMPPMSHDLHQRLAKIRQSISGALVADRRHPEISLVRRFAVVFGSQFPVSRGVFASSFADFVFGSLADVSWRYLKDDGETTDEIPDFPRSAISKSSGQELSFYPKPTVGVNGGLMIKWKRNDADHVFFSKLCHCSLGRPASLDTMGRFIALGHQFKQYGSYTKPGSSHLARMALDFREIAIYVLLEAVGMGPRVIFFIDAYSAGSFHILTEKVEKAIFPTSEQTAHKYEKRYKKNPREFLDALIIVLILGLRDCHRNNFCCTRVAESSSPLQRKSYALKIIDFIAPEGEREPEFPEYETESCHFRRSPLLSGVSPRFTELRSALDSAIDKLGHLSPPQFRLAVYPRSDRSPDFASLIDGTDVTAQGISYSDFLLNVEAQIRDHLLGSALTESRGPTLAESFGLTDTERIWKGEEFERAIGSATQDPNIVTFNPFFDSVFRSIEQTEPPSMPSGPANKSVNYALTMLRWFGIWIGRRIANMKQYFDSETDEEFDPDISDDASS